MIKWISLLIFELFCLCALSSGSSDHESHGWGYPKLDESEEFQDWGGKCDDGRQQSPIDISIDKTLRGVFPELKFHNYDSISGCQIENNGHSIQLSNFSHNMEISGGPLNSNYIVEQIHFHWWSEHLLNHTRYPLEMHVVHRNSKYQHINQAMQNKDGILVLGVLYHYSNIGNPSIEYIASSLIDLKLIAATKIKQQINKPISLDELIPGNFENYVTYNGSLTTPSCNEIVTWIIPLKTIPIKNDQILAFQKIENGSGDLIKNNYRKLQRIRNRPIINSGNFEYQENASSQTNISVVFIYSLIIINLVLFKY